MHVLAPTVRYLEMSDIISMSHYAFKKHVLCMTVKMHWEGKILARAGFLYGFRVTASNHKHQLEELLYVK